MKNKNAPIPKDRSVGMGLRADFDADDKLLGIEITAPHAVNADQVNTVLARLGAKPLHPEGWAPLRAA